MKTRLLRNYTKNSASSYALLSCVLLSYALLSYAVGAPALALDRATVELLTKPLEPALFQPNATLDPSIITPDQVSQTGLTPPSLWWTRQQFGNNLLSYWLAYPSQDVMPGRVDLIVNQQIWNDYNYPRRYAFINQFGTTAKEFRYNLRVFNFQGELLGAQICQFTPVATNLNAACSIFLNPYGRGAFRGSATLGASSPTGDDRPPGR
jgi:hypothetical protein